MGVSDYKRGGTERGAELSGLLVESQVTSVEDRAGDVELSSRPGLNGVSRAILLVCEPAIWQERDLKQLPQALSVDFFSCGLNVFF